MKTQVSGAFEQLDRLVSMLAQPFDALMRRILQGSATAKKLD
jgi:hypothetical protein